MLLEPIYIISSTSRPMPLYYIKLKTTFTSIDITTINNVLIKRLPSNIIDLAYKAAIARSLYLLLITSNLSYCFKKAARDLIDAF